MMEEEKKQAEQKPVEGATSVVPPLQDYTVVLFVGQGQIQKQLAFVLKLPNDLSAVATVAAFCGPRFPYVMGFSVYRGLDSSDQKALLCIGPMVQVAMAIGPELNKAVSQLIVPVGKAVVDHESFKKMVAEDRKRGGLKLES